MNFLGIEVTWTKYGYTGLWHRQQLNGFIRLEIFRKLIRHFHRSIDSLGDSCSPKGEQGRQQTDSGRAARPLYADVWCSEVSPAKTDGRIC